MIKKLLKEIITDAYAEGYKQGAEDIVHRMSFVYDVCRQKGREDGMTDVGVIPDLSEEEFNAIVDDMEAI